VLRGRAHGLDEPDSAKAGGAGEGEAGASTADGAAADGAAASPCFGLPRKALEVVIEDLLGGE
jgi:hypothetical protein